MNRLISLFNRPHELGELGLNPDRPRPPPQQQQGGPEYFVQLLNYLRERNSRESSEEAEEPMARMS